LRKYRAQLAKVISTEMGKIFSEAEAEIEKCAVPTFVARCTNRWKAVSQKAQACCAAVNH
jgi:hypothetical protein